MKKSDYEKIVDNIITPLSDKILTSDNNNLYQLVKLTKKYDERLLKIINNYISFLNNNIVLTDQIDRHKISACVMCAIIKYCPFTIYKDGYNIENLFYANELLGIYTAVSLLECYNNDLTITFPNTKYSSNIINSYVKTLCTSLYINKNSRNIKYSIISYANILYFLEIFSLEQNNTQ